MKYRRSPRFTGSLVAVSNLTTISSTPGVVNFYSGGATEPSYALSDPLAMEGIGVAFDSKGNCYWSFNNESGEGQVDEFPGCTASSTATNLNIVTGFAGGIAFDQHDNLWYVDQYHGVYKCAGTKQLQTGQHARHPPEARCRLPQLQRERQVAVRRRRRAGRDLSHRHRRRKAHGLRASQEEGPTVRSFHLAMIRRAARVVALLAIASIVRPGPAGAHLCLARAFGVPTGTMRGGARPSPIRHVVFIIQENRSFNNLFMGFPGAVTRNWGYDENREEGPAPRAEPADPVGHRSFVDRILRRLRQRQDRRLGPRVCLLPSAEELRLRVHAA